MPRLPPYGFVTRWPVAMIALRSVHIAHTVYDSHEPRRRARLRYFPTNPAGLPYTK